MKDHNQPKVTPSTNLSSRRDRWRQYTAASKGESVGPGCGSGCNPAPSGGVQGHAGVMVRRGSWTLVDHLGVIVPTS